MRQRGVHTELRKTSRTEKYFREEQAVPLNATRFIKAATIGPAKRYVKRVSRQVSVPAEQAADTPPEIGNDHNVGLVVSGAGFQPCLPLAHVVGCSEVCVSVTPPDHLPTELVDQEAVHHSGHRGGARDRR